MPSLLSLQTQGHRSGMATEFWVIAVPNEGKPEAVVKQALDQATAAKKISTNFPFSIPSLKVGTFDGLMSMSEELGKMDAFVGGTAKRLERAYYEIWRTEPQEGEALPEVKGQAPTAPELKIGDMTPTEFVENFKWNASRYPFKRAALRPMAEQIVKDATKADTDLKRQVQEYNEVRNSVAAMEKKESGNLLVRPLGQYISKQDCVETDYLTTLILVVPKARVAEFEQTYEILEDLQAKKEEERAAQEAAKAAQSAKQGAVAAAEKKRPDPQPAAGESKRGGIYTPEQLEEKRREEEKEKRRAQVKNIVPRSAIKLTEDEEFALYRVIVLRKGADTYRNLCRERRWTVRDFKFDPQREEAERKNLINLDKHKKKLWNYLIMWTKTTFADVFAAWMHIKAMRTFVEAVLRYGLPVDFTAVLVQPTRGSEKKVREALKGLYGRLASSSLTGGVPAGVQDVDAAEFYPYVYLTVSFGE